LITFVAPFRHFIYSFFNVLLTISSYPIIIGNKFQKLTLF